MYETARSHPNQSDGLSPLPLPVRPDRAIEAPVDAPLSMSGAPLCAFRNSDKCIRKTEYRIGSSALGALGRLLYGGQPFAQRKLNEIGDVVQIEFLHDVPAMRGNGFNTDVELGSDLLRVVSFSEQL